MGFTNNFLFNLLAGIKLPILVDNYDPHPDLQGGPALTPGILLTACHELAPSVLDTIPGMLESIVEIAYRKAAEENEDETVVSMLQPLINCDSVLYGGCGLSEHCHGVGLFKVSAIFSQAMHFSQIFSEHGIRCASQYGQTELGGCTLIGDLVSRLCILQSNRRLIAFSLASQRKGDSSFSHDSFQRCRFYFGD
jgi:hypothetical protein